MTNQAHPVMEFKDEDVTNFLSLLIGIGGTHYVSQDDEKTIRKTADGKVETLNVDGKHLPMVVYGTKLPNSVIINPFADAGADGNSKWFYQTQNMILSKIVIAIMREILEAAHAQGSKKTTVSAAKPAKKGAKTKAVVEEEDDDSPTDMRLVEFISPYVELVDDKMITEFNQISSDYKKFININYLRSKRISALTTLLFSASMKRGFVGVRVKSWEVFESILASILQTDNPADFDAKPTLLASPCFESFVEVLLNVYSKMSDYLLFMHDRRPQLPNIPEIVATIKQHMQYFGHYFAKAQWCVSSMSALAPSGPVKTDSGSVPWEVGTGALIPVGGGYPPQSQGQIPILQPQQQFVAQPQPMMAAVGGFYTPQPVQMQAIPQMNSYGQPQMVPTIIQPMQPVFAPVGMTGTQQMYTSPIPNPSVSDSVQF